MTQANTPGLSGGAADLPPFHGAAFGEHSSPRSADAERNPTQSHSDPAPFAAGMDSDSSGATETAREPSGSTRKRSRGRGRRRSSANANEESRADATEDKSSGSDEAAPKTRKRTRRRKKTSTKTAEANESSTEESQDEAPAKKTRRRTTKRGGKTKAKAEAEEAPVAEEEAPQKKKKKSRRGSRGRGKKKSEAAEAEVEEQEEAPKKSSSRRRGKRGGRKRSRSSAVDEAVAVDVIPGEFDDLPELPELPADAEVLDEGGSTKKSNKKASKKKTKKKTAKRGKKSKAAEEDEEERTGMILVNSLDHDEQRVAVVEDGKITDFDMNVETKHSHVGDIYRGRVVNLEPAIGAAFVDFGRGRNGFLHTSDVLRAYGEKDWSLEKLLTTQVDPDEWEGEDSKAGVAHEIGDDDDEPKNEESKGGKKKSSGKKPKFRARPRLPISDLLKKGQQVVVQVTKDAIGDKGPTLTTYISIPGRYLVLMPSMARRGVSRKIEDDKERRRLKRIVDTLKAPDDMGVIVRTAGVGRTKIALKRDLEYLLGVWETFGRRLRIGSGPAALYQESDVAIRTMRDLYSTNIEAVVVDDEKTYKGITEFAERLMPEAVERVKLHEGPRPLFHTHGVEQDYEKIFARRVDLPSGGSIVLDQTEALVAIDVNSGRTRSSGFDFEAIALKTNMEAVPEIARQIRLRDLGGIIVVDFIDMMKRPNMRTVERAFRDEMSKDRARSKLGRISQFGLLEMTRQRLGPGLDKKVFTTCPRCRGTARIRTVESRASAILRRLGSALTLKGFSTIEVRAHPEVVEYLEKDCQAELERLKTRHQRALKFTAVVDQPEDSVLRYLRTDGREVRPGGRRKH